MNYLLAWEYYRVWVREHDAFLAQRKLKETAKVFKPDLKWNLVLISKAAKPQKELFKMKK